MNELQSSWAYFRDEFVPFSEANFGLASSPILYGLSVYTTISTHWDAQSSSLIVFRLKEHFDRLVNSASILDFGEFIEQWDYQRFEKMITSLVKHNSPSSSILIRVSVFIDETLAGTRIHGLKNGVSAFTYPVTEFLPLSGTKLCVSSWVRTPDNAIPSRAKANGSYINASLMKNEALVNGYDDAVSLDQHGHVAESTVANLFLVSNNILTTPDASTDMLEGITRSTILTLAGELGIPLSIKTVDRSELYTADEMFLSGSSAFITPVISVDGRQVGDGNVGGITQKLTAAYKEVRENQKAAHPEWRTVIRL